MKKLTYEYVKEYIESFGYELLSKEYIDNRTPLEIKCNEGHIINISFSNFKKGRRCKHCQKQKVAKIYRKPYEEVKEYIESYGYELLSEEYINAHATGSHKKVWWECPNGHVWKTVIYSRARGNKHGCPVCAGRVNPKNVYRYNDLMADK